jgi:IS4 transposase
LPAAIHVEAAGPHESRAATAALERRFIEDLPERWIGDKAFDCDGLDRSLEEDDGVERIAPNRSNRGKTQDGRPLRRYRRRWKVERLFAWLQHFRRILVRYDYYLENYIGFVHLGCILILLRHL